MDERPLLLICATDTEAAPIRSALADAARVGVPLGSAVAGRVHGIPVVLAVLGVGKTNTAAGTALAVHELAPAAVVQFGIGGAYVHSFLSVGMVVAASGDVDLDAGFRDAEGWQGMEALGFALLEASDGTPTYNEIPTDARITDALAAPLHVPPARFGTSDTVTAEFDTSEGLQERFDLAIESMEGSAAAQVCAALGVPFGEIRGVSNIVGERNKGAWNIPYAVREVGSALLGALPGVSAAVAPAPARRATASRT